MSENIEKLRESIAEADEVIVDTCGAYATGHGYGTARASERRAISARNAALAAVEQELLMRARSEAYLAERVEALEAQQAQRAQELAALEAERDELRKRPTYNEVTRAIWEDAPMGLDGNGVRIEVARNVDKLFDGKAHP